MIRRLLDAAQCWHVTDEERGRRFTCDAYLDPSAVRALRGIDVDAPADVLFRWVCQVRVAPYSYDWIDNWGRRSPRTLTPGADKLEVGQYVMIGDLVEFEPGRELTVVTSGLGRRLFGRIALTYEAIPVADDRSRLLCCIRLAERGVLGRPLHQLLLLGDLVMMRKQFMVLKECAETTARSSSPTR